MMRIGALALSGIAILAVAVAAAAGSVRPGTFDPTFAGHGFVTAGFGTEPAPGGLLDAAPMPDGGFVALTDRGSIGRYRADGSLDTTFAEDGYLIHEEATAVATGADGAVYAVERSEMGQVLARWTSDGTPDLGFGSHGTATLDPAARPLKWMRVLADGSVLLAGADGEGEGKDTKVAMVAVRRLPDGSPDPGFGNGGTVVLDFGSTVSDNFVFALDGERLLFAAGAAVVGRLTPSGSVDPGFSGADGFPPKSFGGGFTGLVVRSDGDVALAIGTRVAAMLPDGGPDPSFGEGGVVKLSTLPNESRERTIVAGPGGRVVLASTFFAEGAKEGDLAMTAVAPDGSVDPTFGTGGTAVTDAGGGEKANSLISLAGGDLLLAGNTSGYSLAAARYTTDGALVPSFGEGGVLVARPLTYSDDQGNDLVAGKHGRVVVTGRAAGRILIASYLRDGRPDPAFGSGGLLTMAVAEGDHDEEGLSIARYPGGRFLVGTRSYDGAALLMLDARGNLVRGFGDGGIAHTDFGRITDLAVLEGGRILAAGSTVRPCVAVVERFDSDGVEDPGFGKRDGRAKAGGGCRGAHLAVRPEGGFATLVPLSRALAEFSADGKGRRQLVVPSAEHVDLPHKPDAIAFDSRGGLVIGGTLHERLGLVRVGRDGKIDPDFGRRGFVLREVGAQSRVTGIRIDTRGRIVVAGQAHTSERCGSGPTPTVVRFLPGGGLDRAFGRAGVWTGLRGCADVNGMTLLGGRAPALTGWAYRGGEYNSDLLVARLTG